MKKNLVSSRRSASILAASLLVVLGCLYFFNVSANTEPVEDPPAQNLVLGRLAFEMLIGTQSGPQGPYINTGNADGSGQGTLTSWPPQSVAPAWSPDGARIAFVVSAAGTDIWVMDSNGGNKINLSNTMGIDENGPAWGATGKIAYERGGQIWVMNADGTNQMQFAGITQPSPGAPAWSNDGTKLAFTSGGEIWKINADGTGEQRVTTNTSTDSIPSWSHDAAKIVFRKAGSGIAVVNADGTNEVNLTTNTNDTGPAWSPDGSTIAFTRGTTPSGIYVMDVTGANQVLAVANMEGFPIGRFYTNPAWQPIAQAPNTFTISGRVTRDNLGLAGVVVNLSGTTNAAVTTDAIGNYQFSSLPAGGNFKVSPSLLNNFFIPPNRTFNNIDGNRIADFAAQGVCRGTVCARNGKIVFELNGELHTVFQDGTGQTNITNHAAADVDPNWSPDGIKIAFASNRDGNYEIYRKNAEDDPSPTRLTNNTALDRLPYYSPDGNTIVFTSNRDGNNEIYKMNADGTNQVRLTDSPASESQPAFSPDGQKILFTTVGPTQGPIELVTMNADGSNRQQLPSTGAPGAVYVRPSYSPDGSKILMGYGFDIFNLAIWTMNADGTNRVLFPNGGRWPTYSADGTQVAYACCFFNSMDRLRTANTNGSLERIFPAATQPAIWPDWQPLPATRRSAFDFDGDGRSDISFFRGAGGFWHMLRSTDGPAAPQWGLATDVLTPGDYDGDLKTDLAIWRESDNNFYVLNSFDGTVRIENFGLAGDVPTGGDFDGDGKAEVAVYRPGAQSTFYYRASMGNPVGNITSIPWGVTGDKPVVGDYDGDGRSDAAVYRPSSGIWYVRKSTDAQMLAVHFGLADDDLVPADYDGDAKTDFAVFRAGVWYLLRSTQGFTAFQFGLAKDIPAPADYDGDGRADVTIFRDGVWWTISSQTGTVIAVSFGAAGDKPIPAAYVR